MKKFQKIILFTVAAMMVFGLALPAGAAGLLGLPSLAPQTTPTPSKVEGTYQGVARLSYVAAGTLNDELTPPDPAEAQPPDLGGIDLAFVLTQTGSDLIDYVDLEKTLVFSKANVVDGKDYGPKVTGTFDGTNLTLVSELVSVSSGGKWVDRKFDLKGEAFEGNPAFLSGEYRETVEGYGNHTFTVVGTFTLELQTEMKVDESLPDVTPSPTPPPGGLGKLYLPIIRR